MDRSVPTVFISYRRRDTALIAELLADRLRDRFRVFFDVEAIELGVAFMSRIQQELSQADVVLVVIGADWDTSRLHDPADVVAYELRVARRFGRRTIPVVAEPAAVPAPASLPHDLTWLSELNAFVIPQPPGHRAALVQLADLLAGTPTTTTEAPRTAFAVPLDAGMLRRQQGNIRFREVGAVDDVRLCGIASDGSAVWLASPRAVELKAIADGRTLCSADERNAEWLHRTRTGAIVATSAIGYQAPDTISVMRVVCQDGRLEKSESAHGWAWQTPPLALSPDEGIVAGYMQKPGARRDHIAFIDLHTEREVEYLETSIQVSSLCFDPTGQRLYMSGRQQDRRCVARMDVASRSVDWSHEVESELVDNELAISPELHYWAGKDSLLLVLGSRVLEIDASSGESRGAVLTMEGRAPVLATDASTSLACIVDDASVVVFSAQSQAAVSLPHGAERGLACDVHDGCIVVVVDDAGARRLLIAQDVAEALDGPAAESPA